MKKVKYMLSATTIIICINILIFLMMKIKIINPKMLGSSYETVIVKRQFFRIITAAFTQYEFYHIFCNMYSLVSLGSILESKLGATKFVIIYMSFVVLCGTTSVFIHKSIGDVNTLSIGASGVICALFAMLLVYGIRINGPGILRNYIITIAMLIFMTFDRRIDSIAHFTGVGYGILFSFLFLK